VFKENMKEFRNWLKEMKEDFIDSFNGDAAYSYYKLVPIVIGFRLLFIALGIAMLFN
jgi:hypothetical protein